MKIENEFRVSAPIEEAWALLTDIPAIAPCLPGAELTGQDDDTFEGKIKIKVGPVSAAYTGTATITELDETNHRVLLSASGRDSRGSGNASAEIIAVLTPDGDGTNVSIDTDLKIAGKVAQFGRGVMADVSKKLIGQFAECLRSKLDSPDGEESEVESGAASGGVVGGPAQSSSSSQRSADGSGDTGDTETEALDLLEVAGGAMAKRLIPVVVAVIAIIIVIIAIA
jgi:hypothetical protein